MLSTCRLFMRQKEGARAPCSVYNRGILEGLVNHKKGSKQSQLKQYL